MLVRTLAVAVAVLLSLHAAAEERTRMQKATDDTIDCVVRVSTYFLQDRAPLEVAVQKAGDTCTALGSAYDEALVAQAMADGIARLPVKVREEMLAETRGEAVRLARRYFDVCLRVLARRGATDAKETDCYAQIGLPRPK